MAEDHYSVLGVERDATLEDIQSAYRKCALKWHPDVNPGNEEEAAKQFKRIEIAFEVLSDPVRRREHDRETAPLAALSKFQREYKPFAEPEVDFASLDRRGAWNERHGLSRGEYIVTTLVAIQSLVTIIYVTVVLFYAAPPPPDEEDLSAFMAVAVPLVAVVQLASAIWAFLSGKYGPAFLGACIGLCCCFGWPVTILAIVVLKNPGFLD